MHLLTQSTRKETTALVMTCEISNRLPLCVLFTHLDTNYCIHSIHFLMKRIQSKKCILAIYYLISDTYVALPFLGLLFAYYSLEHPERVVDFFYTMSACLDTIEMAQSKCIRKYLLYGADTYDKYSQCN
jgi:hypothetical protein